MSETYYVATWDHKEQPDWDEINLGLDEFNNPHITLIEDTGSDQHAVIIANGPVTQTEAHGMLRMMMDHWTKNK